MNEWLISWRKYAKNIIILFILNFDYLIYELYYSCIYIKIEISNIIIIFWNKLKYILGLIF